MKPEAASRREGTGKTEYNSALFIRVLIMKRSKSRALMDSFWCIYSSKTSKSWGCPDATFLLRDCVCMPQVCLTSGPSPGSVTEDEFLLICMQGHRRAHTLSFEDLFMREAVFLDVTDVDGPEVTIKTADSMSVCQFVVVFGFDVTYFRPAVIVFTHQ